MAMGVVQDTTWQQSTVSMEAGDVLVLYSDGITDAENEKGASFGAQSLQAAVQASLGSPAHEIKKALVAEIEAFVGGAIQFDDVTLMIITRDA
jgi:sigma-B regulation protein RsbU (phosphoserine phosphatase)